jgi:hypothetical protein
MINIIVGVIFIIGGLSGSLALRGTGSPIALAVVGVALVIWGIIQASSRPAKSSGQRRNGARRSTRGATRGAVRDVRTASIRRTR